MFSSVRTSSGVPSAKTRPSESIRMRSEYLDAMFRSWQIIMTIIPRFSASSFSSLVTFIWYLMSRFEVGSSSSSILDSCARPRASITF